MPSIDHTLDRRGVADGYLVHVRVVVDPDTSLLSIVAPDRYILLADVIDPAFDRFLRDSLAHGRRRVRRSDAFFAHLAAVTCRAITVASNTTVEVRRRHLLLSLMTLPLAPAPQPSERPQGGTKGSLDRRGRPGNLVVCWFPTTDRRLG